MTPEQQEIADLGFLVGRDEMLDFLSRAIQMGQIHDRTTDGSDGRNLAYAEGRRNLVLELLADAARGLSIDDPSTAFKALLFQILRREAQQPSKEPKRAKYDRSSELHRPDD